MDTLNLFKEAFSADELLDAVKNEWNKGDFLKPMAVGGGLGGLGYGTAALFDDHKEKGKSKLNHVLSQLLKGTALGAGAGAAYGGSRHLLNKLVSPSGKEEAPPSNGWAFNNTEKSFEDAKTYAGDHPISAVVSGGATGGAVGAGVGGLAGKFGPERSLTNNPDYMLGKQTESLIGQNGEVMKRLNKAIEAANKAQPNSGIPSLLTPGANPNIKIDDVISRLSQTANPTVAGETVGYVNKLLKNMPQSENFYSEDPLAIERAGRNLMGASQTGIAADPAFTKALSAGMNAKSFDDLGSIKKMRQLVSDSELSNFARGFRKGGIRGATLGALGGGTLSLWKNLSDLGSTSVPGQTRVNPDYFKNVPLGY